MELFYLIFLGLKLFFEPIEFADQTRLGGLALFGIIDGLLQVENAYFSGGFRRCFYRAVNPIPNVRAITTAKAVMNIFFRMYFPP